MLKIDVLLYLNTCVIICASCGIKTSNTIINPGAIQAHCSHCGQTGQWRLEDAYWTDLRTAAEERTLRGEHDSSRTETKAWIDSHIE